MESQNLKASTKLSQAREKVKRKYPLPVARRQLSTGYLEDALEEDEETDHYGSHRSNRGYEEDLEAEAQRERRIMNAKKGVRGDKDRGGSSSRKRKGIESDEEESPPRKAPTHRRMAMVYDSDED
ncbi:Protein LEO1-like protein [Raphanus sativus]|nr:Protein LEO1-like protein [Raphanus sativus]